MRRTPTLIVVTGLASLAAAEAHASVTGADKAFLIQDVQGGRYELALAKLGATRATRPAIRQFSQMVVRDHATANRALDQLVRTEGVTPPDGMTSADNQRLAKLKTLSGNAFDQAYVAEQGRINSEDEQDANKERASTQDSAIKAFISRFAAMDEKHRRGAQQLKTSG